MMSSVDLGVSATAVGQRKTNPGEPNKLESGRAECTAHQGLKDGEEEAIRETGKRSQGL